MEARTAFGDDTLYLERYIDDARHIEFQVLGDGNGHAIHMFERECTIQRRHQKLIEEAPSPFLDEELRSEMGAAAVAVAEAVNYKGAGTVEFLCDPYGSFFFIEMNTRIQVEHPVTEEICGVDLIRKQVEIAEDRGIGLDQEEVHPHGWAIECRINAEDPLRDFLPGPGDVRFVHFPSGQGVRVDSHIYPGYTIPRQYDSLIAKVIARGEDRRGAIAKMIRALDELVIDGVSTTALFHKRVLSDPAFIAGNFSTSYIENNAEKLTGMEITENEVGAIAMAVEVYLLTRRSMPRLSEDEANNKNNLWKLAGRTRAARRLRR
jgi:acetyl-CoA carboxylase biotin carboxylase subunit